MVAYKPTKSQRLGTLFHILFLDKNGSNSQENTAGQPCQTALMRWCAFPPPSHKVPNHRVYHWETPHAGLSSIAYQAWQWMAMGLIVGVIWEYLGRVSLQSTTILDNQSWIMNGCLFRPQIRSPGKPEHWSQDLGETIKFMVFNQVGIRLKKYVSKYNVGSYSRFMFSHKLWHTCHLSKISDGKWDRREDGGLEHFLLFHLVRNNPTD